MEETLGGASQYFVSWSPAALEPGTRCQGGGGGGGARWGGGPGSSCPCQAHQQGVWGLRLPFRPLGAEEAWRGLGPEVAWTRPSALSGERGQRSGGSLSSVQPASPPSNLLPDMPGKSLFLLRLMARPR